MKNNKEVDLDKMLFKVYQFYYNKIWFNESVHSLKAAAIVLKHL